MKTLLTGATGLIGWELVPGVEAHTWAPEAGPPPASAFHGVEVVFNLAGEPVGAARSEAA